MQGQMQNDLGMQQMEPDLEGSKGGDSTAAPEINIKKAKDYNKTVVKISEAEIKKHKDFLKSELKKNFY